MRGRRRLCEEITGIEYIEYGSTFGVIVASSLPSPPPPLWRRNTNKENEIQHCYVADVEMRTES